MIMQDFILINNKDYLLLTSNTIKASEYCYTYPSKLVRKLEDFPEDEIIRDSEGRIIRFKERDHAFVVAHLPLNSSPILYSVDLLPNLKDEEKPISFYPKLYQNWSQGEFQGTMVLSPIREINSDGRKVLQGDYYYYLIK